MDASIDSGGGGRGRGMKSPKKNISALQNQCLRFHICIGHWILVKISLLQ